MSNEHLEMVTKFLKEHFVFFSLCQDDLEIICNSMFYCEVEDNNYIFK